MVSVAGGILRKDGHYLIAQRKLEDEYGLKWEFPGGVLEVDETLEECIVREFHEELGIRVEVSRFYHTFHEGDLHIHYYLLNHVSGMITIREHEQVQWVQATQLPEYDLLTGDRTVARKIVQQEATTF